MANIIEVMNNVKDSQVKVCAPYVNDDAYIDYLIELEQTVATAERRIYDVYGCMPLGPVCAEFRTAADAYH